MVGMYKLVFAAVLALLMAGCAGEEVHDPIVVDQSKVVPPPAHADEAIGAIVADWGMQTRPIVWWYGGGALDCPSGRSWKDATGICRLGISQDGVIIVSAQDKDPGDPTPLHFTALAHEMGHCASDERGEGGDRFHDGHFFNYADGHDDPGNVDDGDAGIEEQRLAALGM